MCLADEISAVDREERAVMVGSNYGRRYPGGHSVIDEPCYDDTTVTKADKKLARLSASRPAREARRKERILYERGKPIFADLKVGSRIDHLSLGQGTVSKIEEKRAFIVFDKTGKEQPLSRKSLNRNARLLSAERKQPPNTRPFDIPTQKNECESVEQKLIETALDLVGAQVEAGAGDLGVVTAISGGKITVYLYGSGMRKIYPYPQSIIDKRLKLPRHVDVGVLQKKQARAYCVVCQAIG